ncbi:outer membrane protein assembly factor BamB [Marinobacter sp.]|uniref:outer membrane protein assembly factor BamB n=1 Tax=Marinobacter sp. TaxID=50741 RepID=UPI00384D10EE
MPLGNLRRALIALTVLPGIWLAGCSSTEPFEEPAPVPDVVGDAQLKPVWRMSVGDGHDGQLLHIQPALLGDVLYAASADGELVSVDPDTGDLNWERDLDREIMAGVGGDRKRLYLVSSDAQLLSFAREDGEPGWEVSLPNEVLAPPQSNGSLVVAQTIDGKVLAFDVETGDKRWQYEAAVPVLTLRGTATPLVGSEMTLVSFANGQLFGLSSESGQPLWQYAVGEPKGRTELERLVDVTAQPIVIETVALVVGYQGNLAAVDIRNGQEIWSRRMSSLRSPAIAYSNILVTESNGTITAIDGASRQVAWSQEQLAWRQPTAPLVLEDHLLVGDFEGYLHALSLEDGALAGQLKLDSEGLRVPMIRWKDRALVYTNGGRLAAIELIVRGSAPTAAPPRERPSR